jgi:hypothetical protein
MPWWRWRFCGEWQRIVLQHRIDCSGVVMPTQSSPYADKAMVSTATRIDLAALIIGSSHGLILRDYTTSPRSRKTWRFGEQELLQGMGI